MFNPGHSQAEIVFTRSSRSQYSAGRNILPSAKPSNKSCHYCGIIIAPGEERETLNMSRFTAKNLTGRDETLVHKKCAYKALQKLGLSIRPDSPSDLIRVLFIEHEKVRLLSSEDDLRQHHLIMNICITLTGNEQAFYAGRNS